MSDDCCASIPEDTQDEVSSRCGLESDKRRDTKEIDRVVVTREMGSGDRGRTEREKSIRR